MNGRFMMMFTNTPKIGLYKSLISLLLISLLQLASLQLGIGNVFAAEDAEPDDVQHVAETTVGMATTLQAMVLPGDVLVVKDIKDRHQPFVLRIVDTYKHGTDHRYDLEFYALEPGEYDVSEYLSRADGSEATGLPNIWVKVASTLPQGQITPNDPLSATLPRLGGYWLLLIIGGVLWVAGLVALFIVGRRKPQLHASETTRKVTMAEHLRPLVQAAINGDLDASGRAELERSLIAYWCKRLGLQAMEPGELISRLRDDPQAGPLISGLEDWLHRPEPPQDVDLEALLDPYRSISDAEFQDAVDNRLQTGSLATTASGGAA